MPVLLKVEGIKKHFKTPGGTLHAVDGVSFELERGKTIGIVGESGCGKSTLGRAVINLIPATGGKVLFKGKDITAFKGKNLHSLRKDMQMIFQDPFSSLNPRMTVSEIIREPIVEHKIKTGNREIEEEINILMETVGLASRLYHAYPHELDGGRRQRIGIARALALNPDFIVCDEPVSALDVSIQSQILNLMQDLQEEKKIAYMFITHDLSVVRHMSDDIAVMYLGVVVEKCSVDKLFQSQLHPYTKALLSSIPSTDLDFKKSRIILKGEITSPINPGDECRFAARCNYATDKCFKETPVLRDIGGYHYVACHYAENLQKGDSA
ncbi:MAG: ATP-binding cassette domain-containing protein [Firmicutes bacterium]|nr:ATP-binding cassette domain-containing protein [Bacillota bacterium]